MNAVSRRKNSTKMIIWTKRQHYRQLLACLALSHACVSMVQAEVPDISGIWMPAPSLAETWEIDELPLKDEGLGEIQEFDRDKHDSASFCLPFGTPRNTLNTAPSPVEIIQSDSQITIIFDGLGDIRRIFTDQRSFPEDPIPSWLGYSIGTWEDDVLSVETISMTDESILSDEGLPHSTSMKVEERIEIVERQGEILLKDTITIHDSEFYSEPLTAERYFIKSPHSPISEGSALCLLDQWRSRLEEINRSMYRDSRNVDEQEANQ